MNPACHTEVVRKRSARACSPSRSRPPALSARLTAVDLLRRDQVNEGAFYHARYAHLMLYAEYAANLQPLFAHSNPAQIPGIYEPGHRRKGDQRKLA
jgi:hypothetical protein